MTTKASLTELPMVQKVVEVVAVMVALFVFAIFCTHSPLVDAQVFGLEFVLGFLLGCVYCYMFLTAALISLYTGLGFGHALVVHDAKRHWFERAVRDTCVLISVRVVYRYMRFLW